MTVRWEEVPFKVVSNSFLVFQDGDLLQHCFLSVCSIWSSRGSPPGQPGGALIVASLSNGDDHEHDEGDDENGMPAVQRGYSCHDDFIAGKWFEL